MNQSGFPAPPDVRGLRAADEVAAALRAPSGAAGRLRSQGTEIGEAGGSCCDSSRRVTPLKIQRKYSGPLLPTHAPLCSFCQKTNGTIVENGVMQPLKYRQPKNACKTRRLILSVRPRQRF